MKLSIHTTVTDPEARQYPWREAIASYCDLADEVIVVDGSQSDDVARWCLEFEERTQQLNKIRVIKLPWPEVYTQREFPLHLNAGLNECTGDWTMKLDIDHIIHERSMPGIRAAIDKWKDDAFFLTFGKLNVIDRSHAHLKTKLPMLINRRSTFGKMVQYGVDEFGKYNDWSWPVIVTGCVAGDNSIPVGEGLEESPELYIGEEIWNYDYFFRTKEVAKYLFARAAKGYRDQTGRAIWGADDQEAWKVFIEQQRDRSNMISRPIHIDDHPKYIRERVRNLTKEEFGFDHWQGDYL